MDHIAIDLGGRESQICVRQSDGTIVEERRVSTRALGAWFSRRAPGRVIVETCAESFAVAELATQAGHQVRLVPATLVRALGVGARGVKTDRRDAQVLSEASCRMDLPSVHLPSHASRERKSMSGMREALVGARTQLINCVRGWLRTQMSPLVKAGAEGFPKRVRELYPDEGMLPGFVERQLASIEHLSEQIKEADKELSELAKTDAVCERLMSVPGVGPVTAVRFCAALDEVQRFSGAHAVAAYLGLVPGEDSSSERKRITSITKAGPTRVRWSLVQAAWAMRRCAPNDPMVLWSMELEKRSKASVAVVALARKMAGLLYALWRDGSYYDAHRGSTVGTAVQQARQAELDAALALLPGGAAATATAATATAATTAAAAAPPVPVKPKKTRRTAGTGA